MNSYRILALLKMELYKLIREPAYLFLMILFPAVLTITFGFAFNDPELGSTFNNMVPGLFAYACIFIIMTVSQSFADLREQGVLRRLNTTPMSPSDFMMSNILSNMILSMLQVMIVFVLALIVGFESNSDFIGIIFAFLLMALFSLSSVGLGLITASISRNAGVSTGISFIFILPQMFFGTFLPLTSTTRVIAVFLPSYYATDALTSIFSGANLLSANILIDFAFITIFSIVIVILGILIFKKYGNK